jgi:hypothetical protein
MEPTLAFPHLEDVIEHLVHILTKHGYPCCRVIGLNRHTPSGETCQNSRQLSLEYVDDLIIFTLKVKPFCPDLTAIDPVLSLII